MSSIEELMPNHAASLHITHNDHKGYYQTVAQSIADGDHGYREEDWISSEQKLKAIDADECWTVQWYPNTPVGFNILSGVDLESVLKAAREYK